jgi:hypothetical protein
MRTAAVNGARQADSRQTAKCTDIGMEDQAEASGNLQSTLMLTYTWYMHIVCISGGAGRHELSPDDSGDDDGGGGENEQTRAGPGVASSLVTNCHQITVSWSLDRRGGACAWAKEIPSWNLELAAPPRIEVDLVRECVEESQSHG